jgi:hypothetical protein
MARFAFWFGGSGVPFFFSRSFQGEQNCPLDHQLRAHVLCATAPVSADNFYKPDSIKADVKTRLTFVLCVFVTYPCTPFLCSGYLLISATFRLQKKLRAPPESSSMHHRANLCPGLDSQIEDDGSAPARRVAVARRGKKKRK